MGHAIDHYSRPNLIDLGPMIVFEEWPHFRRQWKAAKFIYLAQNTIETAGDVDTSLFDTFTLSLSANDGGHQK